MSSSEESSAAPRLSVVTVNRDMRDGLARTLASVLGQSGADLELIVVDGASRDGSVALLDGYDDARLRWASEPDRGIYDAMNKGVARARGEWVIFVNAGDELFDGCVLADFAPEEWVDADIVCGDAVVRYGDGSCRALPAGCAADLPRGMPFAHNAAFVRRSVLRERPFGDETIAGDYAFFVGAWLAGRRFACWRRTVALVEAGGVSDRRRVLSTIERIRVLRRYRRMTPGLALWHGAAVCRAALAPGVRRLLPAGLSRRLRGASVPV